jgi:hypothetical protein
LGFHGALLQVRGDWSWFKQLFGFKGWASSSICWRCGANRSDQPFWDFSLTAAWRASRQTTLGFLQRLRSEGQTLSPLFGAPGFTVELIVVDVLHALDLGVAQDALGNLFKEALHQKYAGTTDQKVKALFADIKGYYRRAQPPSQLQGLTLEMIQSGHKSPKLRAKGAETRYLVPFGLELALAMEAHLGTPHALTVARLFSFLMDFYVACSTSPFSPEAAASSCRQCCLLWGALASEASQLGVCAWVIKPKHHLFQELGEYMTAEIGNPRDFWCYKDEDFVGFIAQVAASRGGGGNASTTPTRALQRYRALAE